MNLFFSIGKSVLFLLSILLLSLVVGYLLPAPLTSIHIGTLSITMYILIKEKGHIVWYMLFFYFCQELLFPGEIYGTLIFAGTWSALIAYWSHRFILTNRSMYTGLLLGILTITSYRCIAFLYQGVITVFTSNESMIPPISWYVFVLEGAVTEAILFVLLILFLKKKEHA
ncbi:MAG: hypothetical protein COV60_00605 [Candidatus Magasanikbacteria bacterium CG11_big_fil_rev_8_21_14_0_20_43_7]|uniref:Rod shape-determining protein MreD n=1 Tax=Candidatus Magasanikbacteria bacterium CG11_big_fil_rev_8_21_14_0_20_43_7 TaxID=1974654 RepID=A0A2H0N3B5_9BACT|nr:MAG: hypothetical protein COV60_00605 [Candidatus Magasanikbacteria bacterium CG11_big_fil_rev_8_21_14_0_20_43_7]